MGYIIQMNSVAKRLIYFYFKRVMTSMRLALHKAPATWINDWQNTVAYIEEEENISDAG